MVLLILKNTKPKGNHKNGKKGNKKEEEEVEEKIIEIARLMTFHSDTIDAKKVLTDLN